MIRKSLLLISSAALLAGCAARHDLDPDKPRFRIGSVTVIPSSQPGSAEMAASLQRKLSAAARQCMTRVSDSLPVANATVQLSHYNHHQPFGIVFTGRSKVKGYASFGNGGSSGNYQFGMTDNPEVNWRQTISSNNPVFYGPAQTRERLATGATSIILQRLYPECRGHGQVAYGRRYKQPVSTNSPILPKVQDTPQATKTTVPRKQIVGGATAPPPSGI